MDYSDIFTRPIEEITDDEIIQRARELREKGRYPVIVKTPVDKKPKAKKKTKAEEQLEGLFNQAQKLAEAKKQDG